MHLERLLKQHRQLSEAAKRILEINPAPSADRAARRARAARGRRPTQLGDFAWLLLDQARILEGETLPDPAAFAHRLSSVLARGLA